MVPTIHVVASCTKRKRATVADQHRLREVPDSDPEHRARSWWDRLQPNGASRIEARDLYGGSHWTAIKDLADALMSAHDVRCWVASAGYGLVGWGASLLPYSATFTPRDQDSVVRSIPPGASRMSLHQRWWHALSTFSGPVQGEPRSLAAIAELEPSSTIVIVASPTYVHAMETDLLAARKRLHHPEQLVIVSNRARLEGGRLSEHLVPVEGGAQAIVGGPLVALNARVARALLHRLGGARIDVTTLRARYAALIPSAD